MSHFQRAIYMDMIEAERKAIDSLARYKFVMFGYWCGVWVHLNRLSGVDRPSPFAAFVKLAKKIREENALPVGTAGPHPDLVKRSA
jgi:hypothetical protein